MHIFAAALAVLIVLLVLRDAFEATVFPGRTTRRYRPARMFFFSLWFLWRLGADRFEPGAKKQHFLSVFGPFSLLMLFATWVAGLIFAFALLHWSLAAPLGDVPGPPSFAACAYLSGETIFTLGYGDLAPTIWTGRFLSVLEAGMGFGFLAVVIGYLPVLNQAFSRREQAIGLLDARAGSPPTAAELLRRLVQTGNLALIEPLLWEWERWSVELLEAQLSFPVLAYYRSQHDNQSWLAGLTVILDTCSLLIACVPDNHRYQVQMTFAMARHAAVDLTLIFKTPALRADEQQRLHNEPFQEYLRSLAKAGLKIDCSEASCGRLAELRAMYEPFIAALAAYFRFEIPPIAAQEVAADNWQRSPWLKQAPGIGSLPENPADDHFS